jgi:hypothetical protein
MIDFHPTVACSHCRTKIMQVSWRWRQDGAGQTMPRGKPRSVVARRRSSSHRQPGPPYGGLGRFRRILFGVLLLGPARSNRDGANALRFVQRVRCRGRLSLLGAVLLDLVPSKRDGAHPFGLGQRVELGQRVRDSRRLSGFDAFRLGGLPPNRNGPYVLGFVQRVPRRRRLSQLNAVPPGARVRKAAALIATISATQAAMTAA